MYGIIGVIIIWITLKTVIDEHKHKKEQRRKQTTDKQMKQKEVQRKSTNQFGYRELNHLFEPSNRRR